MTVKKSEARNQTLSMPYKDLKSYQQAIIVYDFTVEFCQKYISKFSRTVDQMVQAARSGKQNIVEGTAVSQTSPKTELKLIGVARGSLEELLEDYKDFLRQRKLEIWAKEDPRSQEFRKLAYRTDANDNRTDRSYASYAAYKTYLRNPEEAANAMLTLINQTNFLLDRQMSALKKQLGDAGISNESHGQMLKKVLAKKRKANEEFDTMLKGIVRKAREEKGLYDL